MTDPISPEVRYQTPTDALSVLKLTVAWLFVGIPLLWAVWQVFEKALVLFHEGT